MIEVEDRSSRLTRMQNYRKKSFPCLKARDEAIRRIQKIGDEGRAHWKQEIGYHRRSRVETLMFRYKTILRDRLSSRKESTHTTETAIKLDVLNRMTELGMPKSYKVVRQIRRPLGRLHRGEELRNKAPHCHDQTTYTVERRNHSNQLSHFNKAKLLWIVAVRSFM